jgi:two-component system sensor histidine kinase DegS
VLSDAKKLAAELVELERSQIGNELHDGVIPLLFVASSTVTNLRDKFSRAAETSACETDGGDLSPALDQLSDWLNQAMQASRRLLTETYPPDLDHCDWHVAAADTLGRLFPEWNGRVQWDMQPGVKQVGQAIACAAYRIVLEAVRNACQHGDATEVLISSRKVANSIEVTIRDNGSGFEPDKVTSNHFGIRVMRGRAELVSGKLSVLSALGGPTTVLLVAPIVDEPVSQVRRSVS